MFVQRSFENSAQGMESVEGLYTRFLDHVKRKCCGCSPCCSADVYSGVCPTTKKKNRNVLTRVRERGRGREGRLKKKVKVSGRVENNMKNYLVGNNRRHKTRETAVC